MIKIMRVTLLYFMRIRKVHNMNVKLPEKFKPSSILVLI